MNTSEFLSNYAEGFGELNATKIKAATAPNYQLIGGDGHVANRDDLEVEVAALLSHGTKMEISDVATNEMEDGKLMAWCLWSVGDDVVGSGRIIVGPDGVESEWLFMGANPVLDVG
jgi:hypothetical protein